MLASLIHKPLYATIAALVVAAAVGVPSYYYINSSQTNKFDVGTIQSNTLSDVVTVDATTTTEHLTLGFVTGGRIQSVSVEAGNTVKKGQVLASLDLESTAGSVTQAEATYAAAKASYDKLVNGASSSTVNVAETSVSGAELTLHNLIQDSYTSADSVIRTDVDNLYGNQTAYSADFVISFYDAGSNTNVTLMPSDIQQRTDLGNEWVTIHQMLDSWKGASKTTSDADVELTLSNLTKIKAYLLDVSAGVNAITYSPKYQSYMDKYKANVAAARTTIDGLISGIQNAKQAIATAQTNVSAVTSSARPEDVAAAKAQVQNAYGALQIAQAAYANRLITAPVAGTISAVHITPGEIASPNTAAIEMTSTR